MAMAIASTHAGCGGQTAPNLGISEYTNRITTPSGYTYDLAGNLTANGVGTTYTWNGEGRMAAPCSPSPALDSILTLSKIYCKKMVGAWGLEPQTSTVSMWTSCLINRLNTG